MSSKGNSSKRSGDDITKQAKKIKGVDVSTSSRWQVLSSQARTSVLSTLSSIRSAVPAGSSATGEEASRPGEQKGYKQGEVSQRVGKSGMSDSVLWSYLQNVGVMLNFLPATAVCRSLTDLAIPHAVKEVWPASSQYTSTRQPATSASHRATPEQ